MPAAGAAAVIPAPENQRSKLVCLSFTLTTDPNVNFRYPLILHTRGAVIQRIGLSQVLQSASKTAYYTCMSQAGSVAALDDLYSIISIIDSPIFLENDTLTIDVINLDVAGQIYNIVATWHMHHYQQ